VYPQCHFLVTSHRFMSYVPLDYQIGRPLAGPRVEECRARCKNVSLRGSMNGIRAEPMCDIRGRATYYGQCETVQVSDD